MGEEDGEEGQERGVWAPTAGSAEMLHLQQCYNSTVTERRLLAAPERPTQALIRPTTVPRCAGKLRTWSDRKGRQVCRRL